ncbi:MAG: hypothetical protein NVSMB19_01490 [Vulcanimicrobiaceae bacterium]
MSERLSGGAALSDADLELLDVLLAEDGIDVTMLPNVIPARDGRSRVPLSYAQELVWLLEDASPGMTAYKLPIARRLCGTLDIGALERSFTAVTARHEALRTRFVANDGVPEQLVDAPQRATIDLIDFTGLERDERERRTAALLRERAVRPFDLAAEHAFRTTLVRLAAREHVLLIETHHMACDGWSLRVLFRDLDTCYRAYVRGAEPAIAPPAIQYADYAVWERGALQVPELLEHWRAELAGALEPLELPTDYPRPLAPTFRGARASLQLSRELLVQANELARRHGATLYMLLLAAYGTVLHRYTGRSDILVGSGAAARAHRETENTIGYFTDMLVQRVDVGGDPSFEALLCRVRESCLRAYEHRGVPLEKLIAELRGAEPHRGRASLFEVVLTPQDTIPAAFALADIAVEPYALEFAATKFDVALLPAESDDGLRLTALYRGELFAPETMARLLAHVRAVLVAAVADATQRVSRLPLLDTAEERLIAAANATAADTGPFVAVHRAVEHHARCRPETTAVAYGAASITYGELNARANRLARRLRARGVAAGTPVALLAERSIETIVALLATMKSGGFYVPLAPESAPARIAQQLAECAATVVVCDASVGARHGLDPACVVVPEAGPSVAEDARDLDVEVAGTSTAYALFTSGSTGVPKAVAITHDNLTHYTRAIARKLSDVPAGTPGDGLAGLAGLRFGSVSTLTADLGNTALFPALCAGATLDVIPPQIASDPSRFFEYVRAQPLDVLKITPNHFSALLAGVADARAIVPLRWLIVGGEACSWTLVDDVRAAGRSNGGSSCRIMNHYGPTETTVGAATFEVTDASRDAALAARAHTVPIGVPLANVQLHVLDAQLQPSPLGIEGELYVSGAGVGRGYLARAELTAGSFPVLPGIGRSYRTGDRVRRLATGDLEFLGRIDAQVKVRGFRVEPGEIEAALLAHPAVAQTAVLAVTGETDGGALLYACVVLTRAAAASEAELCAHVAARLPDYMVPSACAFLDALPLTANGKLDRARLPVFAARGSAVPRRPATETERALVAIWAEAFKRAPEALSVDDDFLALGGHSLLAIRVLGKISRQFGVRLSLTTLFEAPTIETLARAIESAPPATGAPTASIRAVSRADYRVDATWASRDDSGARA